MLEFQFPGFRQFISVQSLLAKFIQMETSNFSFTSEWSDQVQLEVKSWLTEKWTEIAGEAPDQDFLEYILVSDQNIITLYVLFMNGSQVMIKNQKKMLEISHELIDLGIEETNAR